MAEAHLESELTTAAVLATYGRIHKLPVDHGARILSPEIRRVLLERFAQQGTPSEKISEVEGLIAAAQQHIGSDAAKPLSAVAYDKSRRQFVSRLVRAGSAGVRLWPPTSQTVRAQLGGQQWNTAMRSLGIPISTRGKAPGPTRFSREEYVQSVTDFIADSQSDQSFRAYGEWVAHQNALGAHRPSGPALRKFFGSWSAAKEAQATERQE